MQVVCVISTHLQQLVCDTAPTLRMILQAARDGQTTPASEAVWMDDDAYSAVCVYTFHLLHAVVSQQIHEVHWCYIQEYVLEVE